MLNSHHASMKTIEMRVVTIQYEILAVDHLFGCILGKRQTACKLKTPFVDFGEEIFDTLQKLQKTKFFSFLSNSPSIPLQCPSMIATQAFLSPLLIFVYIVQLTLVLNAHELLPLHVLATSNH